MRVKLCYEVNSILRMLRILATTLLLMLTACAGPVPKVQDFDHFDKQYSELISYDIELLQKKYAAGEITREQMDAEIARYEHDRYRKVNELVEHSHNLKQMYAKTFGIPLSGPGRLFNKITSGRTPQINPRAGNNIPRISSFDSGTGYRGPQPNANW